MKQNIEQVREVGTSKHASNKDGAELSIGDALRLARKQLMTRRILVAIIVILLVTLFVFLVTNGFFEQLIDYLIGLAE
ncbi:MAG: hypothetical protein J5379_10560 [Clostridiales bacterium]|nr:hypothetical protein [Clostridiales bacterium]